MAGDDATPADANSVMELATSNDPRAVARGLREQPVMQIGDEFTLVTRRPDVEHALRQSGVFSWSAVGMDLGNIRPLIPLQIDPPQHVKYRRILDPLFAPKKVAELEDDVVSLVRELVAKFSGRGSVDLHEEFAVPLPCTVFLRLLGLPYADLDLFLDAKDDIIRPPGDIDEQARRRRKAGDTVYEYFSEVIERRKSAPSDDLLSKIMASELDGERLTDEEVLDISYLFMIAGLDTVTDSLDCFFALLAQEPEQRQRIVDDDSVIPSAVEEMLRWESPVPAVPRRTLEDIEIAGCPIAAGSQVMLLIGSANTDHDAHPGLDTLDLGRNPNPHLAFGGGVHRCLGSHLARLELRLALREFHRIIPSYELAPGTELEYTAGLRSLHHLPLVFDPVG
jgi:cytochrome P450